MSSVWTPGKQARLYDWIDSEREAAQQLTESAQIVAISVEGGELRLLHTVPRSAATGDKPAGVQENSPE